MEHHGSYVNALRGHLSAAAQAAGELERLYFDGPPSVLPPPPAPPPIVSPIRQEVPTNVRP